MFKPRLRKRGRRYWVCDGLSIEGRGATMFAAYCDWRFLARTTGAIDAWTEEQEWRCEREKMAGNLWAHFTVKA